MRISDDLADGRPYDEVDRLNAFDGGEPNRPRLPYVCRCGQLSGDVKVCDQCRGLDRGPQGEAMRLFEPAPNQIPGQLGFTG